MSARARRTTFSLAAALLAAACGGDEGGSSGESESVARGRAVYQNVCIACHHGDPAKKGSLGPAVAGSSLELLEAKVLRGEYPPGYEPRMPGAAMPKYEYVAEQIPDLAAYLAR